MGSASRMAAVVIAAVLVLILGFCALQWLHGMQRHWREQQRDSAARYGVARVIRANGNKPELAAGRHGVNAASMNAVSA